MVKYVSALGAVVAIQGALALKTRVVPDLQYPKADACHPTGTVTYDTWPPCLSQGEVEGLCAPPSEDVAGWTFQRDCMCKGSFFDDAIGCGACKKCNALQGHNETAQWDNIFTSIKTEFCTDSTPTNFGTYWEAALKTFGHPEPMEGDVRNRCVEAGDVVVENYYKAPKQQGPGMPRPSEASPKPIDSSTAIDLQKNATQPAQPSKVVLYAAATARVNIAVVTGLPVAPVGPKSGMNVTAEAKAVVTYGLASMDCQATFVDGFVQPSCDALKLIPGSDAMVPPAARADAIDLSRCVCATEFLAPKKLCPAPEVAASASVSVNVSEVNIFSPEECQGPCSAPLPAASVQPNEDCVDCTPEEKGSPAVKPKANDAGVPSKGAEKPAAKEAAKGETPAAHADVEVSPAGPAANGTVAPVAKPENRPAATGAVPPPPASPISRPVTAGAASAYGPAAVLAVAFAVFAL